MFKNSKLSRYRVEKIIECFCLDIEATKTAQLLRHNRKTINRLPVSTGSLHFSLSVLKNRAHPQGTILAIASIQKNTPIRGNGDRVNEAIARVFARVLSRNAKSTQAAIT